MDELAIRLKEQLRIYRDSPQVTATYIDLARFIEDLLCIIEQKRVAGFNKEGASDA